MTPVLQIIHLPYRQDRLQSLLEEMNEQSIAFNIWEGITTRKTPVENISAAHKQIIQKAKDENWPFAIIAEDDIKFSCAGAWKYYLSKMPKVFDLYVGLVYSGHINSENRITKGMSGTNTLYTISSQFYDTLLATDDTKNLDRELGKDACVHNYYVCNPMVCYQMNGKSDHFNRIMNYDPFLQDKKLYGQ